MSASATFAPGATGEHGMRYEWPVIFAPSCTRSRTAMRRSHLPDAEAGQPGQTRRSGAPCRSGSGSPSIAQASSVSSSIAFAIGTPREIGTSSVVLPLLRSAPQ